MPARPAPPVPVRTGTPHSSLVALALVAGAGLWSACAPAPLHFSEQNARAHVNQLAGAIGSRPAGSDANRRAREYLVEQLRFYGFTVRVQDVEARRPALGRTARVANIIAIHPGRRPEAIGLVAHYDSGPSAPGAGDNALGVSVALETGRILAARRDRAHSLMILLTDGEEIGLMGAAALVEDPEVQARLRACINVEAIGSDGPVVLFETGADNGVLVRSWARAAHRPRGGSHHLEVYRRLPNDTDFSVLKRAGVPGLNFAAVGDGYAYHTPRDTPDRLTRDAIVGMGRTVLATAEALDSADVSTAAEQRLYFDLGGLKAVVLAPMLSRVLSAAALAMALLAWLRVVGAARTIYGWAALVRTAVWGVLGLALVAGAMVGTTALLRAVREVYHPWYARPARFWLLLALAGVLAADLLYESGRRLPRYWQAARHPAAVWMLTLPIWAALLATMEVRAPAAAPLWSIPLLALAGLVAAVPGASGAGARVVAAVAVVPVGVLWLREAGDLLRFSVPMFGRLPIITPVAAYPGILLAVALMMAPPLIAMAAAGAPGRADVPPPRWRRRFQSLRTPFLFAALSVMLAASYYADAYTPERPQQRQAQYVADHASGRAVWEVAGTEPGLELDLPAGAPSGWAPATPAPLAGAPVRSLPHPFVWRAPAALAPPPVSATLSVVRAAHELQIEVAATPTEPGLTLAVVLPHGSVPLRASLPGQIRGGWWTATYAAAPSAGVSFSAALLPAFEPRLAELRVGALVPGLPGGRGWLRHPPWLAGTRAVWHAWSVHLVTPAFAAPPTLR